MGQANIEADPRRFNWLGATSFPGRLCVALHTAQVKTPADLFTHELIVGSSGAGTSNSILPTVFNHVLGTKFRIIEGYRGTQDVLLAVERGEVHGVCATTGQFRSSERLIRDGTLRVLLQRRGARSAGVSGRAVDLRPGQDRRAAPVHALCLRQHGVRAALRVSAGRAQRIASSWCGARWRTRCAIPSSRPRRRP